MGDGDSLDHAMSNKHLPGDQLTADRSERESFCYHSALASGLPPPQCSGKHEDKPSIIAEHCYLYITH